MIRKLSIFPVGLLILLAVAILRIDQAEDFRGGRSPIDRLARLNARPERRSMKI
jgi:hypothetical protein